METSQLTLCVAVVDDSVQTHLLRGVKLLHTANKYRLDLEKLFQDNGFTIDIRSGQLDPKMASLFPNHGVNVLERAMKLLTDNPWQEMIAWQIKDTTMSWDMTACEAVRRAGLACHEISEFIRKTSVSFALIAPQPSEEEIAAFQQEVIREDSHGGDYWLTNWGAIGTYEKGRKEVILVRYLLQFPQVIFPHVKDGCTFVELRSLTTAFAFRDRMKKMMEQALEADKEREEKRKVPSK
jgi:hypothetical protein